jgi:amidohydrolase
LVRTFEVPDKIVSDVVALRRDFHMHPELGFEEHRTAGIVADRLRALGFDVHAGIARTGVVGVMKGTKPGRTIMLRADMDALPILEENAHAYRSTHDGKMHACGHDGHVAMLLGAAQLIADGKERLAGTVCLLFQPAEEGHGGARVMVEEGTIERFGIERAYGLHLSTKYPTGTLGFREGPFYASSDSIEIEVLGKGGHGSAPHDTIDPIYTAANFITSVQQIVSRHVDPLEPAVVTIGSIHGGTIHNVIPRNVRMLGTVRAFSDDVRNAMPERIERVLKSCCDAMGAHYNYEYLWRYPVTANDPDQTRYARELAEQTFGAERVITADKLMGAEDFSFFAQRVPACFYTLGAQSGPSTAIPHHSSTFDIDERALPTGVAMMAALAFDAPANAP